MDQVLLERIGKPVLMFAIAFFAARYITGSNFDGFLVGLIPLILGVIGILQSLGYMLTALLVILAVVMALLSPNAKRHVRNAFDALGSNLETAVDDTAGKPAPPGAPAPLPQKH